MKLSRTDVSLFIGLNERVLADTRREMNRGISVPPDFHSVIDIIKQLLVEMIVCSNAPTSARFPDESRRALRGGNEFSLSSRRRITHSLLSPLYLRVLRVCLAHNSREY